MSDPAREPQSQSQRRSSGRRRVGKLIGRALLAVVLLLVGGVTSVAVSADLRAWMLERAFHYLLRERFVGMPAPQTEAQPVRTLQVAMRDGVRLETHLYLPKGPGPWPVILVRDPYGLARYLSCTVFVHYGYACVHQDVRGRWGSGGAWYPLVNERDDGIDTIRWILAQPWQDQKIALAGESYLGMVQWAMADELPPEVKTLVAGVSHGDMYGITYHNGMFMYGVAGNWSHGLFQPLFKSLIGSADWRKTIPGQFPALGVDPKAFGPAWTSYHDYLLHPEPADPYWHSAVYDAIRQSYLGLHAPVLLIGRNNDFFTPEMLAEFNAMPSRAESLFIFGPGDHGGDPGVLPVKHPHSRYFANNLGWFDHFLKDKPLPADLQPGYRVYINGADAWQRYDTWPGPTTPLTLHLDHLAQAHRCDGGLLSEHPAGAQSTTYAYDPRHPVPTRGGSFILSAAVAPIAVQDQKSDLCSRADVLSFGSAPMATDQTLSGTIHVRLQVASDAADTAFSVKLSEHFADGRVYNIRDDISTLSLRNGAQQRLTYRPGDPVEVDFDLVPVAWRLKAGSRLRLDVSSSNFPAFNPHPNTAGLWSAAAAPVVARQTLFGGDVVLPMAGDSPPVADRLGAP